jgi:hypothetical protein
VFYACNSAAKDYSYWRKEHSSEGFDRHREQVGTMAVQAALYPPTRSSYGNIDLLEIYTRRELSHDSDALNAIVGALIAMSHADHPIYHVWGIPVKAKEKSFPRPCLLLRFGVRQHFFRKFLGMQRNIRETKIPRPIFRIRRHWVHTHIALVWEHRSPCSRADITGDRNHPRLPLQLDESQYLEITANTVYLNVRHIMSIQACRDAWCNGTLSLPDPRIVRRVLEYRQVQYASILQLSFSQHISL